MTQPKVKIHKGDDVIVITGKDRGKKGKVLAVYPRESRVLVEGVNVVKKHVKPGGAHPDGGIMEQEALMHISNVALIDPKSGKATRIGFRILEDGKKVRYAKKSGELLD